MKEFISKYKNFKIYDDKGRVYPLHIDKALYLDCKVVNNDGKKSGEAEEITAE